MDETRLVGDWKAATERLRAYPENIHAALKQATLENAVDLVGAIKEGIISQAPGGEKFAPLHPFTIAMRLEEMSPSHRKKVEESDREGKALINHGDLVGAVNYAIRGDGLVAKIGVKRMKNSEGEDLVNIAKILTDGAVIPVSAKMRAYLHYKGLHLNPATTHLVIPPRPFILPVYRQRLPKIKDRYKQALHEVRL